ncbi:MAG: septum formation initiator family protein [Oscillospiraceae bacterium]|nr:septum formation initiator family protein [Oscillospiraceae bacterium]
MTKKKSGRKGGSGLLLKCSVYLLAGYLVVTLVGSQMDIMAKRQELADLQAQCLQQEAENTELQRLLSSGDAAENMERIAREKLGYTAPEEIVFIDVSGK